MISLATQNGDENTENGDSVHKVNAAAETAGVGVKWFAGSRGR